MQVDFCSIILVTSFKVKLFKELGISQTQI